jgi:predicted Zn-dependent protease
VIQLRSRRDLLKALSAGLVLGACSENPATGRRQLSLVSDEALAALGQEAWADALARMPKVNDRAMQARLERIGEAVAAQSRAQTAAWEFAVMGHEIGHIEARHSNERMSQQLALQIGVSLAAAAMSEEYGQNAEAIASALGAGVLYGVILPYSRLQELEADRLGLGLMRAARFDPEGALSFWRRMAGDGGEALEWMSTHPADTRRLEALAALVEQSR